ncbi:phage holin family protein [Streptomyces sp. 184]|uniref:phage holin family protein n=1 Tax=Streptomyces sp. 184 TaxID=1827526 RepID=UPI00389246A5
MSEKTTDTKSSDSQSRTPSRPRASDISGPVAKAVREEIRSELRAARDEVREELIKPPRLRNARLYAGAGAATLYAGGALAATLVLVLALLLPDWAAALIVTALLAVTAVVLRQLARQSPEPVPERATKPKAPRARAGRTRKAGAGG